jgi:hypothetical protein
VLSNYFLEKTDHQVSGGSARNAGRLLLECFGPLAKASAMNSDADVKKFVRVSLEEKGHAISTLSRNLGVIAAAFRHSKIEVQFPYSEGAILAKWPQFKPKPKRKLFEPTDAELARLLGAPMTISLRQWVLNSMATAGRPEAVLDLSPSARVRDRSLIDLNPEGRRQNKKYRPTVRELVCQRRWLNQWEKDVAGRAAKGEPVPTRYCEYASVDSVDTALERVCKRPEVNLPRMAAYSIRHRATSVLRASKNPRVLEEQVNYQLGHRRPSNRTSRGYGEYGPEYLSEAAQALEGWIARVFKLAKLNSHGIPTGSAPPRGNRISH